MRDLVVGDIVDLNQGDRVPADCIILDEMNIVVDQSMYEKQATRVPKEESTTYKQHDQNGYKDNHAYHPDPFLFTDSKIMNGQGKAIVCCVGDNTLLSKSRKPSDLVLNEQKTDLEKKLEKVSV